MSEQDHAYPSSHSASREQGWPLGRGHRYPPPRDVGLYASRALPLLPSLVSKSSSSPKINNKSEEDHSRQQMSQRRLAPAEIDRNGKAALGGTIMDGNASAVLRPSPLPMPDPFASLEDRRDEAAQTQHPIRNSKLEAMCATGDEQVSPIDIAGSTTWRNYAVSPLSGSNDRGSMDVGSWLDDNSTSDDAASWESPSPTQIQQDVQPAGIDPLDVSPTQETSSNRHSDPGSVFDLSLERGASSAPLPNLNAWNWQQPNGAKGNQGFGYTQPGDGENVHIQPPIRSMSTPDPRITNLLPKINTFSSSRPGVNQRAIPPPLRLKDRAIVRQYVNTPYPRHIDLGSSPTDPSLIDPRPKVEVEKDRSSPKQDRRRSRLGSIGASIFSSSERIRKPPPGFTEVISQIDHRSKALQVPKVRNLFSKAKHGLGIGAEDGLRKEKSRNGSEH